MHLELERLWTKFQIQLLLAQRTGASWPNGKRAYFLICKMTREMYPPSRGMRIK